MHFHLGIVSFLCLDDRETFWAPSFKIPELIQGQLAGAGNWLGSAHLPTKGRAERCSDGIAACICWSTDVLSALQLQLLPVGRLLKRTAGRKRSQSASRGLKKLSSTTSVSVRRLRCQDPFVVCTQRTRLSATVPGYLTKWPSEWTHTQSSWMGVGSSPWL